MMHDTPCFLVLSDKISNANRSRMPAGISVARARPQAASGVKHFRTGGAGQVGTILTGASAA